MLAVGIPVLTLMKANLAALVEVPPSSAAKFALDRKSTRLNSSHQIISYAVFCLKKKKPAHHRWPQRLRRQFSQAGPVCRLCPLLGTPTGRGHIAADCVALLQLVPHSRTTATVTP